MEGERFAEARHVVVSAAARVVGGVDSDAEVGAHYKHADVEAQSDAGAERYVFPESFGAERTAGARRIVLEKPDVTGVKENRSMERPVDREAQLGVEFELECARLVEVAVGLIVGSMVAAGAERSDGKGADRVCAADIELLAVGHLARVAVGMCRSDEHTADQPYIVARETLAVDDLSLPLDELAERCAEKFLLPLVAESAVDTPENVACLLNAELHVERAAAVIVAVVGPGVGHLRYILVLEALCYGFVGVHYRIEVVGGMDELRVGKLHKSQRIVDISRMLPVIGI